MICQSIFFFFNDTATTEIYTLSLHDALPISAVTAILLFTIPTAFIIIFMEMKFIALMNLRLGPNRVGPWGDRKSTRLNSSHANISYAVFCLKKKNNKYTQIIMLNYNNSKTMH